MYAVPRTSRNLKHLVDKTPKLTRATALPGKPAVAPGGDVSHRLVTWRSHR